MGSSSEGNNAVSIDIYTGSNVNVGALAVEIGGTSDYTNGYVNAVGNNTITASGSLIYEPTAPNVLSIASVLINATSETDIITPTSGYTSLGQFGISGDTLAVFYKVINGNMLFTANVSDINAQWVSLITYYDVYLTTSSDLGIMTLVDADTPQRRYRVADLGGESGDPFGHTFLWAGVTTPAVVQEAGYCRGRVYWKGFLVEEE